MSAKMTTRNLKPSSHYRTYMSLDMASMENMWSIEPRMVQDESRHEKNMPSSWEVIITIPKWRDWTPTQENWFIYKYKDTLALGWIKEARSVRIMHILSRMIKWAHQNRKDKHDLTKWSKAIKFWGQKFFRGDRL